MRRRILGSLFLSAALCGTAAADQLFITETVSRGDVGTLDVELRPAYRSDEFKIKTTNTLEYTATVLRTDARARWVPAERCEAYLELPYLKTELEADGTGAPAATDESGLGQVIVGGKYVFSPMLGVALRAELPTADQSNGLGEGLNLGISLLGEKVIGAVTAYGNLGYLLKQEYTANGKINPGDVVQIGGAVKHTRWGLDWTGEAQAYLVGKSKFAGATVANSDATAIDLVAGAAKALNDQLTLRGGLGFGVGEEKGQSFDLVRGAGDYRVFLAAVYRLKI